MSRFTRPSPFHVRLMWRIEWIGFMAVTAVLRSLPLKTVFHIGESMGTLAYKTTRRYRHIVTRNLRIAVYHQNRTLDDIDELTLDVFRRTGSNFFSALKTATMSKEELKDIVEIENFHLVEQALEKNRGILLLLAHMGNWELLAQLNFFLPEGTKAGTHYRPLTNPFINKAVEAKRSRIGTVLFEKQSSTHGMIRFLRENNILGILADQRSNAKADACAFFDRLTGCSPMPQLLARRSECETLSLAVTTVGPGQWKLSFHSVSPPQDTQAMMTSLCESLSRSLADGFWFQDRWRSNRNNPIRIPGGAQPDSLPETKTPMRVLWWGKDSEDPLISESDHRPDLLVETVYATSLGQHQVSSDLSQKELEDRIHQIDRSHRAPVELLLHSSPLPDAVRAAAKSLSIRTHQVSLPSA